MEQLTKSPWSLWSILPRWRSGGQGGAAPWEAGSGQFLPLLTLEHPCLGWELVWETAQGLS